MTTYMKDSKAPPRARGKPLEGRNVRKQECQNVGRRQAAFVISTSERGEISTLKEIPPVVGMTSPVTACGGSKPAVTWVKPPGEPGWKTRVTVPPTTGFTGGRLLLFRTSVVLCDLCG